MAKRIVIADDSATIQRAFAMTFGAEDVTLVPARSAEEGLTLARQTHADLIIADGMMPGRSGYDLCASIKSDPGLRSIPVYILTSSQQPYDDSRGRQCGAEGHFSKPFDTAVIIEQVHQALAKGPSFDAGEATLPRPFQAAGASSSGRNLGVPVALDTRATVPHMISSPLASDEDDYGEISVDISPPEDPPEDEPATEPATAGAEVAVPYNAEPAAMPVAPAPVAPSAPMAFASPPPARSEVSESVAGEIPAPVSPASLFPPPQTSPTVGPAPLASMRPSLIPGVRPSGVAPPSRPGAVPTRPAGVIAPPPSRPPAPVSRTLMGLPAANLPMPGSMRPVAPPARSATLTTAPGGAAPAAVSPARPAPLVTPAPTLETPGPSPLTPTPSVIAPLAVAGEIESPAVPVSPTASTTVAAVVSQAVGSAVGAAVDEKMAAIAARGPEYAAIAKLSRQIIEEIVWEIVPELAEAIIREHLREQLGKTGRG
jgi:CheY-like chemotaxis protein